MMNRGRREIGCLSLVFVVLSSCACRPQEEVASPNLVVIVLDTFRADHAPPAVGRADTPFLTDLAARGVSFARAYSPIPATGPSHATLFTGQYPFEHGVTQNAQALPDTALTLAEILAKVGYRNEGVVSLAVLREQYGFSQGFEHWNDEFSVDWHRPAAAINEAVEPRLETAGRPYFLFVHYSDPHEPYTPPTRDYPNLAVELNETQARPVRSDGYRSVQSFMLEPGRNVLRMSSTGETDRFRIRDLVVRGSDLAQVLIDGEAPPKAFVANTPIEVVIQNAAPYPVEVELRLMCDAELTGEALLQAYREEVEYLDSQLARLFEMLESRGMLENTYVILTADHGEALGEHDHVGHIENVYEESVRVPLLISGPGISAGGVEDTLVGLVDVLPTVIQLLGVEGRYSGPGRDLFSDLSGRSLVAATFRPLAERDLRGLVSGEHKLIVDMGGPARDELYDLVADPAEQVNLAAQRPGLVASMSGDLEKAAGGGLVVQEETLSLTEEEEEMLRALGYVE